MLIGHSHGTVLRPLSIPFTEGRAGCFFFHTLQIFCVNTCIAKEKSVNLHRLGGSSGPKSWAAHRSRFFCRMKARYSLHRRAAMWLSRAFSAKRCYFWLSSDVQTWQFLSKLKIVDNSTYIVGISVCLWQAYLYTYGVGAVVISYFDGLPRPVHQDMTECDLHTFFMSNPIRSAGARRTH